MADQRVRCYFLEWVQPMEFFYRVSTSIFFSLEVSLIVTTSRRTGGSNLFRSAGCAILYVLLFLSC